MFNLSIAFLAPKWLILLTAMPLLWWISWQSLSGLGLFRKWLAIVVRTVVMLTIILSLAELQMRRSSDKLTVVYLLDQSMSIPEEQRRFMIEYTNKEVLKHRKAEHEDRAGVIVFAREPSVEQPPFDDAIRVSSPIESLVENDATNLAGALKMAQAILPEDSAGRIVLISDGNENLGDAREQARRLAEAGIGIDVVPIRYSARSEVAVEKIAMPPDVNRGQPFDLQVVINNMTPPSFNGPAPSATGKLKIIRKTRLGDELRAESAITVKPGKNVQTLRGEVIDTADFFTYTATFVPDNKDQDFLNQNNTATSFTQVRGKGQVLLLEYVSESEGILAGKYDYIAERLKKSNIQVTVREVSSAFSSLGDLQPFDSVILGNTPRDAFSDEQIRVLVQNTQQMGAGLIMLGGPQSFGAGGWGGSDLEAAMPVDFQIKNAKVIPSGALAIVLDCSGSMSGEKLTMAVKSAMAAVDVLSEKDYVSVTSFDSAAYPIVQMTKLDNPSRVKRQIASIGAGGGTFMYPAMEMGYKSFERAEHIAVKHMIILTDGMTQPADHESLIKKMRAEHITVSTIAVGNDADKTLLSTLARSGGGKFFHAKSPKSLPRIFMQEARKISRPLIYENPSGFTPVRKMIDHEILKGMDSGLPPLSGYVRTTLKNNPLVEVALTAPFPIDGGDKYNTLLASWTYGLGKVAVWTSDTGRRWANQWEASPDYDRFLSQMIRWSMRPTGDTGKFTVVTETRDGVGRVIVTALDKDDQFLNFLTMSGNVSNPDSKSEALDLHQVAPGRYESTFKADKSGNYFAIISPGQGKAPILTGTNVPYSTEFLDREPNEALLQELADYQPLLSERGKIIEPTKIEEMLLTDTFRHNLNKAVSIRDIWHWVLFGGGCLFLIDVFNRRVSIDWRWFGERMTTLKTKLMRRPTEASQVVVLDRLRSRKAELQKQLDEQRSSARYEPSPDAPVSDPTTPSELGGATTAAKPKTQVPAPAVKPEQEQEDYTSRLLKAKKKVWDDPSDGRKK